MFGATFPAMLLNKCVIGLNLCCFRSGPSESRFIRAIRVIRGLNSVAFLTADLADFTDKRRLAANRYSETPVRTWRCPTKEQFPINFPKLPCLEIPTRKVSEGLRFRVRTVLPQTSLADAF